MRFLASAFVALSALTLVAAQSQTNFTIDANAIPLQQKATWCQGQRNACDSLCPVAATTNTCDTTTLAFSCICQDGSTPALARYLQTMPTFICEQAYTDCINRNVGNRDGQEKCKTDIKNNCGTLEPNPVTTTSAATPTPTTSGTTGAAGGAAVTTTSTRNLAPTAGAHFGNGAAAVAIGVLAYLV